MDDLTQMLEAEISAQASYFRSSRPSDPLLDILTAEDPLKHDLEEYSRELGPSEPEPEVYVDKRLYQGNVSWGINSDTSLGYALLPVTLSARGGRKNGGGGGDGGGGGETSYFPNSYVSGKGEYHGLTSDFNIELSFAGSGWTAEFEKMAISMAELYSYFIVGDEEDVQLEEVTGRGRNRTTTTLDIDDVHVTLTIDKIDGIGGTLGYAGPEYVRVVDGNYDTTIKGGLTLDSDDLATYDANLVDDVIFHEIGHILGFGTLFSYQDLVTGNEYTGQNANDAYQAAYEQATTPLLLEDQGGPGTAGGHWEETTGYMQGDEIMTGYINDQNWLSTVSIAAYEDLGYDTIWGDELLRTDYSVRFLEAISTDWHSGLTQYFTVFRALNSFQLPGPMLTFSLAFNIYIRIASESLTFITPIAVIHAQIVQIKPLNYFLFFQLLVEDL